MFVCLFLLSDITEFEDIKKTSHIIMGKFVHAGLIQASFLGGECRCVQRVHVCALVYPLDFNEILDIFKDKKRQIQLYLPYCIHSC